MKKALLMLVLLISTTGFASAHLNDGLIAHWDFDDGSGSTLTDVSGNGHHGTIHGNPEWTTGVGGSALRFDGTDDHVEIADVSDFQFANQSLTFTAWVQIVDNLDLNRFFIVLTDSTEGYPGITLTKTRSEHSGGLAGRMVW